MEARELWKELNKIHFLLMSDQFIEKKCLSFQTKKEAQHFLIKFLVLECIAGSDSEEDMMKAYKEIERWVLIGKTISSEELPIGRHKTHNQKNLIKVMYFIDGEKCEYMEL